LRVQEGARVLACRQQQSVLLELLDARRGHSRMQ
jgi:hypothetical protein